MNISNSFIKIWTCTQFFLSNIFSTFYATLITTKQKETNKIDLSAKRALGSERIPIKIKTSRKTLVLDSQNTNASTTKKTKELPGVKKISRVNKPKTRTPYGYEVKISTKNEPDKLQVIQKKETLGATASEEKNNCEGFNLKTIKKMEQKASPITNEAKSNKDPAKLKSLEEANNDSAPSRSENPNILLRQGLQQLGFNCDISESDLNGPMNSLKKSLPVELQNYLEKQSKDFTHTNLEELNPLRYLVGIRQYMKRQNLQFFWNRYRLENADKWKSFPEKVTDFTSEQIQQFIGLFEFPEIISYLEKKEALRGLNFSCYANEFRRTINNANRNEAPYFVQSLGQSVTKTIGYERPQSVVLPILPFYNPKTKKTYFSELTTQIHESGVHVYIFKPVTKKEGPCQVVFRGTYGLQSALRDMDLRGVGKNTFTAIQEQILEDIGDPEELVVNGHSLGAGDGQRLVARFTEKFLAEYRNGQKLALKELRLHCHCSPKLELETVKKFQDNLKKIKEEVDLGKQPIIALNFFQRTGDPVLWAGHCNISTEDANTTYYIFQNKKEESIFEKSPVIAMLESHTKGVFKEGNIAEGLQCTIHQVSYPKKELLAEATKKMIWLIEDGYQAVDKNGCAKAQDLQKGLEKHNKIIEDVANGSYNNRFIHASVLPIQLVASLSLQLLVSILALQRKAQALTIKPSDSPNSLVQVIS